MRFVRSYLRHHNICTSTLISEVYPKDLIIWCHSNRKLILLSQSMLLCKRVVVTTGYTAM